MKLLPILLLILLSACASPQQMSAEDDGTCRSYGAQPGTEAYVACRLAQQRRRDQQGAEQAERLRRAGAALQSLDQKPGVSCTTRRGMPGTYETEC